MSFVKQSLLLLLLAAVGTFAVTEDCDGLNRTLSATNLDKVLGDWVLVWVVSDTVALQMTSITNSHVQILRQDDNTTILVIERNKYISNVCATYNTTMKFSSGENSLETVSIRVEQDGTILEVNDTSKAEFFETEENSLVLYYRGFLGRFLFIYRRDGHHVDFQVTKEAEADYHKLAGCANLPLDNRATLTEAGDFCHKKYSSAQA